MALLAILALSGTFKKPADWPFWPFWNNKEQYSSVGARRDAFDLGSRFLSAPKMDWYQNSQKEIGSLVKSSENSLYLNRPPGLHHVSLSICCSVANNWTQLTIRLSSNSEQFQIGIRLESDWTVCWQKRIPLRFSIAIEFSINIYYSKVFVIAHSLAIINLKKGFFIIKI